jgi:hypothetical protein
LEIREGEALPEALENNLRDYLNLLRNLKQTAWDLTADQISGLTGEYIGDKNFRYFNPTLLPSGEEKRSHMLVLQVDPLNDENRGMGLMDFETGSFTPVALTPKDNPRIMPGKSAMGIPLIYFQLRVDDRTFLGSRREPRLMFIDANGIQAQPRTYPFSGGDQPHRGLHLVPLASDEDNPPLALIESNNPAEGIHISTRGPNNNRLYWFDLLNNELNEVRIDKFDPRFFIPVPPKWSAVEFMTYIPPFQSGDLGICLLQLIRQKEGRRDKHCQAGIVFVDPATLEPLGQPVPLPGMGTPYGKDSYVYPSAGFIQIGSKGKELCVLAAVGDYQLMRFYFPLEMIKRLFYFGQPYAQRKKLENYDFIDQEKLISSLGQQEARLEEQLEKFLKNQGIGLDEFKAAMAAPFKYSKGIDGGLFWNFIKTLPRSEADRYDLPSLESQMLSLRSQEQQPSNLLFYFWENVIEKMQNNGTWAIIKTEAWLQMRYPDWDTFKHREFLLSYGAETLARIFTSNSDDHWLKELVITLFEYSSGKKVSQADKSFLQFVKQNFSDLLYTQLVVDPILDTLNLAGSDLEKHRARKKLYINLWSFLQERKEALDSSLKQADDYGLRQRPLLNPAHWPWLLPWYRWLGTRLAQLTENPALGRKVILYLLPPLVESFFFLGGMSALMYAIAHLLHPSFPAYILAIISFSFFKVAWRLLHAADEKFGFWILDMFQAGYLFFGLIRTSAYGPLVWLELAAAWFGIHIVYEWVAGQIQEPVQQAQITPDFLVLSTHTGKTMSPLLLPEASQLGIQGIAVLTTSQLAIYFWQGLVLFLKQVWSAYYGVWQQMGRLDQEETVAVYLPANMFFYLRSAHFSAPVLTVVRKGEPGIQRIEKKSFRYTLPAWTGLLPWGRWWATVVVLWQYYRALQLLEGKLPGPSSPGLRLRPGVMA